VIKAEAAQFFYRIFLDYIDLETLLAIAYAAKTS
jgi:hypothetical protein